MNSVWYMTRLRFNVTDIKSGEESRTYIAGASVVGCPTFTHANTPIAVFGLTAINPDVADVWVEHLNDKGEYKTNDGQDWAPLQVSHETIKVRFGKDVDLEIKHTRNGVIIPLDMLEGSAHDLMPWISSEVLSKNDVVDGVETAYALGNVYDPVLNAKFVPDVHFAHFFKFATIDKSITSQDFVD